MSEGAYWTVALTPQTVEDGKGKNKSGIAVSLTDGEESVEVSRVGFLRRHTKNPDVEFGDQLTAEVDKAQQAADLVNEAIDEAELAREQRVADLRAEVRSILGRPPTKPV